MRELPPLARFRQRSRLYLGRSLRTVSGLRQPCVFMHVPKCGGTSVSEALYATVPLHRKIGILDSPSIRSALAIQHSGQDDLSFHDEGARADDIAAFRETLLLMHMAHRATLIHGHFLFSERAWQHFGDRYRYVTILRDPVARTVSHIRLDAGREPFGEDPGGTAGRAAAKATNLQDDFHGSPMRRNIGRAMERALRNMERFSLIGFLEDLDGFSRDFAALFGVRPWIPHYNSAGQDKPFAMTTEQRDRLAALSAPDIELYAHARRIAPTLMQREPKVKAA
ncbi:hypothetical protein DPM13_14545 [Paracoccus mutanolyticus]|uniref:Sulfotransferase family protein n=1 Tax=Paracoccus mutanolyticus TaxID=1499308 RepID=A0ABM6WT45_9RHOB|nr:sulfotransferase family 2 domain-containing protein [Paracoccus mutanolyticus]AWX93848.1 hypothetical protein DPM13_14545 [Paracoccus mutanolyticus]